MRDNLCACAVYFFEWAFEKEGAILRRNSSWEFLCAMDAGELVRPLQLLSGVSTLSSERPNFALGCVPKARKKVSSRSWQIQEEVRPESTGSVVHFAGHIIFSNRET